MKDFSFAEQSKEKKGGLNRDTDPDSVPECLCAQALPTFLDELVTRRKNFPGEGILRSKADVSDAFRNVRVDPDQAHNFCYRVGDLVVIEFRVTFGWSGSSGFWSVMSTAAEHAHCNTTPDSSHLLDEGKEAMAHVKMVDRWEEGQPTPISPDAKLRSHSGGEMSDPFFATVCVDDYLLIRVQHSVDDKTALIASASLASDHVRLVGPVEEGVTPTLAPKKRTDWDATIDALGFTINSHTMRISFPREKPDAIKRVVHYQWPASTSQAKAKDILSMAGKLWNLTCVVEGISCGACCG